MTNIRIGKEPIWDFGFRYNITFLTNEELKVIMIKYEVELKRIAPESNHYCDIVKILGTIYKEIKHRKIIKKLNQQKKTDYESVFYKSHS